MKRPITIYDTSAGPEAPGWPIVGRQRIDFGREPIVLREGLDWIEGAVDAGTHCIDPKTGQPVPLLTFAVTVEGNRISGIPDGATASVRMRRAEVAGGVLEIAADYPETVLVRLRHPLFEPWSAEVAIEPGEAPEGAHRVAQDYRRLRMGDYAPGGDQLDAILKGLEVMSETVDLPAETVAAIEGWRETKQRFPKEPGK